LDGAAVLERSAATPDLERRFQSLVESHRDRALGLAWRLVGGDRAAAEDVTQDAFVKAYQGLRGFRGDAALETWFYRILVRQAYSYRRWRAVRSLWTGGVLDDPADPSPEAPGDPALRRRIAAALDGLTRSQREAFVLVHLEGFRVRECAEVLGKPIGTVKSHLHRALTSLRRDLADLDDPLGVAEPEETQ
jgi:RNA polymerase sigma-70 factor (ECF subfamily)